MGFFRDAEGNVFLEADNPQEAWTPAAWQRFLQEKRAEVDSVRRQLEALPRPDPAWPAAAQDMARVFAQVVCGQRELEARLARLEAELDELERI